MNLKNKMKNFNKRWNITSSEGYEESFNKFKTRILNIFQGREYIVTEESIETFCQFCGIERIGNSFRNNIFRHLRAEQNEVEFYRLLELIFALEFTISRDILLAEVMEAIEFSNVNVAIALSKSNVVILYPKGEEYLDEELVDQTLSFLDDKSSDHYENALKFYESKKHVKSAESLRRTLEEFLRYKLENRKGLEANIKELQDMLKVNNKTPQVRNIIFSTFNYLDKYFNENSKHNDGDISDSENEFLIYQIGLLARYIYRNV